MIERFATRTTPTRSGPATDYPVGGAAKIVLEDCTRKLYAVQC